LALDLSIRQATLRRFCALYRQMNGIRPDIETIMQRANVSRRTAYDYANAICTIRLGEVAHFVKAWNEELPFLKARLRGESSPNADELRKLGLTTCPHCGLQYDPIATEAAKRTYEYYRQPFRRKNRSGSEDSARPVASADDRFYQRTVLRSEKIEAAPRSFRLTNLTDMPFFQQAEAKFVVKMLRCPTGHQRIRYVRCPSRSLEEFARSSCEGCNLKDYNLKLSECEATVDITAPTELFEEAILNCARDIEEIRKRETRKV